MSPGAIVAASVGQELRARAGLEVADGAAEEGDEPAAPGRQQRQVLLEVADHGVDLDAGVLRGDLLAGRGEHRLVDVEGHEAPQRPGPVQRVEQQPGLLRGAAAELDQGVGAR